MSESKIQVPRGATRTDLRVTRAPADTPRGRLHKLAALGSRIGRQVKEIVLIDPVDVATVREIAQRGVRLTEGQRSRGHQLIAYLCRTTDRALGALALLGSVDLATISDALTEALSRLEVAEAAIRDLENVLAFEREHSEGLRAALAAEQARSASAFLNVPAERWEEPTRVTRDRLPALTPEDRRR